MSSSDLIKHVCIILQMDNSGSSDGGEQAVGNTAVGMAQQRKARKAENERKRIANRYETGELPSKLPGQGKGNISRSDKLELDRARVPQVPAHSQALPARPTTTAITSACKSLWRLSDERVFVAAVTSFQVLKLACRCKGSNCIIALRGPGPAYLEKLVEAQVTATSHAARLKSVAPAPGSPFDFRRRVTLPSPSALLGEEYVKTQKIDNAASEIEARRPCGCACEQSTHASKTLLPMTAV